MADPSTSNGKSDQPTDPTVPAVTSTSATGTSGETIRKRSYESTLIPERRRFRIPAWVALPVIFVLLIGGFYLTTRKHIRHINTVGNVVFAVSSPTGGSQIMIAKQDGTNMRSLTTAGRDDESPVFSPDGNQVAFISDRAAGIPQVYVMDADGKNTTLITRNAGAKSRPAYAAGNNDLIGFTSGGVLYDVDVNSGDTERLLPAPKSNNSTNESSEDNSDVDVPQFAWGPLRDGNRQAIAAVEESNGVQNLAVMPSIEDGKIIDHTTATNGAAIPLQAASDMSVGWSADGSLLAVAMIGAPEPGGAEASGIVFFDADANPGQSKPAFIYTADTEKLLEGLGYPPASLTGSVGPKNAVFSPDASQIAFEMWHENGLTNRQCLGIFVVPIGGGAPTPLVPGQDLKFAPDGQSFFFLATRRDGGKDLYHADFSPGSNGPLKSQRVSDGIVNVVDYAVSPQH